MKRFALIMACVSAVSILAADAMAARCSGIFPTTFCDDFDRWCLDPPEDPADACPCDNTVRDNAAMWQSWIPLPPLGSGDRAPHSLQGPGSWKCQAGEGYGLWIAQGQPGGVVRLYRHERSMTPELLANPLNTQGFQAVNGAGEVLPHLTSQNLNDSAYIDSLDRTLKPETLKGQFFMNFQGSGAFSRMISYVELHLDEDRAPFNFQTVFCPYAPATGAAKVRERLVTSDGQVHASFAVGVVATMDTNPCDLDTGVHPTYWRLVVFDGLTWQQFQAPRFGLPLTSPADHADLYPRDGYNFIRFAVGADYIEVRLSNGESNTRYQNYVNNPSEPTSPWIPNPYWVARVPRQYKGPFNKVSIGPNYGRDLAAPTCADWGIAGLYVDRKCAGGTRNGQACAVNEDCPADPNMYSALVRDLGNNMMIEELVLYDGVFDGPPRACCKPDLTCEVVGPVACQELNGVYQEDQTSCEAATCCPIPFADSDNDGDVDMDDFAALQRCLNIGANDPGELGVGCGCFDRNGNGIIDDDDVTFFAGCGSGSGVPADPDCGIIPAN